MEYIREYLISVTAAALLCGILQSLSPQKSSNGLLKLICGIFLSLTVIRPLADIRLEEIEFLTEQVHADAESAAAEGADYAKQAMIRQIKERTEAYILDKAASFDGHITADVLVEGDPPVIISCTIQGNLSAYAQTQLRRILEEDLGIPEEDQRWIYKSSN
jgi:hypothetical protein